MPRAARLDAPGALQHVMARGIEKRDIFRCDRDREDMISRLSDLIPESGTVCFAWAFLPNHVHFLFRSGPKGIVYVMRKLLTGYAVSFNLRHQRSGHLFQNRYKSILCEEEPYLLELVRYIHLNPLRAGVISGIGELNCYPYCGHSALMGNVDRAWQETDGVLRSFASKLNEARKHYFSFVAKGIALGKRDDLAGGGLVRSSGGWEAVKVERSKEACPPKGDDRILGRTEFVDRVLSEANEELDFKYRHKQVQMDLTTLAERVADLFGVGVEEVMTRGRRRERVEARSLLCYLAVEVLGLGVVELAGTLGMAPSSVSRSVARGNGIAKQRGYRSLDEVIELCKYAPRFS